MVILLSPLPFPYTRIFQCQVPTDEVVDTYPRGRGQGSFDRVYICWRACACARSLAHVSQHGLLLNDFSVLPTLFNFLRLAYTHLFNQPARLEKRNRPHVCNAQLLHTLAIFLFCCAHSRLRVASSHHPLCNTLVGKQCERLHYTIKYQMGVRSSEDLIVITFFF